MRGIVIFDAVFDKKMYIYAEYLVSKSNIALFLMLLTISDKSFDILAVSLSPPSQPGQTSRTLTNRAPWRWCILEAKQYQGYDQNY
jgi:hypothetical protein